MRKQLSALLAFLALSAVAGCGTGPALTQAGMRAAQGFRAASAQDVASFGHGLGWVNQNATPILDDEAPSLNALGFRVQDDTPKHVDLRPLMSPVVNQGDLNACTGFAMVKGLAEFFELKAIRARGGDPAKDFVPLSAAYLWFQERAYTGQVDKNAGSNMFLGMNLLSMVGTCPETDYAYPSLDLVQNPLYVNYFLGTPPSKTADADARAYRGGRLIQITKLSEIKRSLDEGYPCVFGFTVFSNLAEAATTGVIPMPSMQEDKVMGGHATVCVGYDDAKQVLILKNSWGPGFGDKGYLYMPYKFFENDLHLVADGWTMREK